MPYFAILVSSSVVPTFSATVMAVELLHSGIPSRQADSVEEPNIRTKFSVAGVTIQHCLRLWFLLIPYWVGRESPVEHQMHDC